MYCGVIVVVYFLMQRTTVDWNRLLLMYSNVSDRLSI